MEAVELDPAMVAVARQWFGFKSGPRMSVTVMDGLDYCRQKAKDGECRRVAMLHSVNGGGSLHQRALGQIDPVPAELYRRLNLVDLAGRRHSFILLL